jgi:hypothetical protein
MADRRGGQHVRAHMRDDQPLGPDRLALRPQRREIEMKFDLAVPVIGFRDEQIRVACGRDQRVCPLGVAGIAERLAGNGDPQCKRRRPARMGHLIGSHSDVSQTRLGAVRQFRHLDREFALHFG